MRKEPLKLSNKKMTQLKMGERGGIKGRKKKKSGREVQADRRLASAVQAGTEGGDAPPTCHQGGAGRSRARLSPSRDEARSPHGTLRGVPWATRQLTSTRNLRAASQQLCSCSPTREPPRRPSAGDRSATCGTLGGRSSSPVLGALGECEESARGSFDAQERPFTHVHAAAPCAREVQRGSATVGQEGRVPVS